MTPPIPLGILASFQRAIAAPGVEPMNLSYRGGWVSIVSPQNISLGPDAPNRTVIVMASNESGTITGITINGTPMTVTALPGTTRHMVGIAAVPTGDVVSVGLVGASRRKGIYVWTANNVALHSVRAYGSGAGPLSVSLAHPVGAAVLAHARTAGSSNDPISVSGEISNSVAGTWLETCKFTPAWRTLAYDSETTITVTNAMPAPVSELGLVAIVPIGAPAYSTLFPDASLYPSASTFPGFN